MMIDERERTEEIRQHHELCLGVLALCYQHVPADLKLAIEGGVEYAAQLGIPVSVENLRAGKALFNGGNA
jgi:hypothetical protein